MGDIWAAAAQVLSRLPPCCFSRMLDIAQEDKRSQLMTCLGTLIASVLIVPLCIWCGQQCTRGTRSSREKVRKLNISATDERKWDPFVCARQPGVFLESSIFFRGTSCFPNIVQQSVSDRRGSLIINPPQPFISREKDDKSRQKS